MKIKGSIKVDSNKTPGSCTFDKLNVIDNSVITNVDELKKNIIPKELDNATVKCVISGVEYNKFVYTSYWGNTDIYATNGTDNSSKFLDTWRVEVK